ncbi:hypothetical protein BJY01DRAFT_39168 [Aspergillus pseudoustus]|uniref:Uncharacterized protein n=1 Tax=Aspergillus pseudoustus TaxID=1810923 RepID=A0ABR4JDT8_9EURO
MDSGCNTENWSHELSKCSLGMRKARKGRERARKSEIGEKEEYYVKTRSKGLNIKALPPGPGVRQWVMTRYLYILIQGHIGLSILGDVFVTGASRRSGIKSLKEQEKGNTN